MALPIRRTRLLDRSVQRRDAWLCIIATEGESTEKRYFEILQAQGRIDRSRVRIEILETPRGSGLSAPNHVISRANRFASRYQLDMAHDQLWLVIDKDRFQDKLLAAVLSESKKHDYQLAVSNPCFELWLLLHVREAPPAAVSSGDCEELIRDHLGGYRKTNLDPAICLGVAIAAQRARALDEQASERAGWPANPGSRLHLLIDQLPAG